MIATLSLSLALVAQSDDAPASAPLQRQSSLVQLVDGEPVCGLGAAFHAGRRAALRAALGNGLVVMRGLEATRDYAVFRQDKPFWYLTGVESPGAALLMDNESGREILFLPDDSNLHRNLEIWEGEIWDAADEWIPELTGFAEVRPVSELMDVTAELMGQSARNIWTSLAPHVELGGARDRANPYVRRRQRDPLDGRPQREQAFAAALEARFSYTVRDLTAFLDATRLIKTPEEIDALRRAGHAGAIAMTEAMRSTRPDLGEWELDALMTWIMRREGADGPAYHAIVGSGPNSCVLHYSASARRMRAGEVVLIDYGPEVDHYTTDITRTWPVGGEFTAEQARMYDAVLAAQLAGIDAVRPGASMGSVTNACRRVLAEAGLSHLMPHGACHWIGLEVHDVGDNSAKLLPGMVFTIEPGVYDPETGVGVRIEDVAVVTEDGCEVLTGGVPKARAEVEALVQSSGVLDREDGVE